MIRLFLFFGVFFPFIAFAQPKSVQTPLLAPGKNSRTPSNAAAMGSGSSAHSAVEALAVSSKSLYIHLVPYYSEIGIVANFEYIMAENFGMGGGLVYLPKKADSDGSVPGLTSGFFSLRGHLPVNGFLDVYVSPGIGLQIHESASSSESSRTTIGSNVAVGGAFQVNPKIALGVEQMWNYAWFDKKSRMAGIFSGSNSSFFIRMSF